LELIAGVDVDTVMQRTCPNLQRSLLQLFYRPQDTSADEHTCQSSHPKPQQEEEHKTEQGGVQGRISFISQAFDEHRPAEVSDNLIVSSNGKLKI
jgi:hypothetical protein